MKILCHRGYWRDKFHKNSAEAFKRSFDSGYGTETDFRDLDGTLVISHDPARCGALTVEDFFAILKMHQEPLMIAINIKSDGLQDLLLDAIKRHQIESYFLFDMSVPDALHSIRKGLRVFTRQSDVEIEPSFYDQAAGVWMDSFHDSNWLTHDTIKRHTDNGKQVCIVSPELHGRPYLEFWNYLSKSSLIHCPEIMLCTDLPVEAQHYFKS